MDLIGRVASARRATRSARIVRVRLDGAPFAYRAGQAALLGPAESDDRVPYSIASSPEETAASGTLEFLIKHEPDGSWGSDFGPLRRGTRLAIRGPVGSFTFPEDPPETHFLFIGGGTGIAPLRAMIHHVLQKGSGPGAQGAANRVNLLYSARTPDDFAYGPEFRRLARRGEISLVLTATRHSTPRWKGKRGRIIPGELALLVDDAATLCFVCGPTAMVADVPVMLEELGIHRSRIRVEDW